MRTGGTGFARRSSIRGWRTATRSGWATSPCSPAACPATPRRSPPTSVDTDAGRALFAGDIVFAAGIIGLINYPGSDLTRYRDNIGRLGGLGIDALLPGHLLFTLGNGQRHIDLAIERLTNGGFVPYSIGQGAVSFMPSGQYP